MQHLHVLRLVGVLDMTWVTTRDGSCVALVVLEQPRVERSLALQRWLAEMQQQREIWDGNLSG